MTDAARMNWRRRLRQIQKRAEKKIKNAEENINEFAEITEPCRLDIVAKNPLIIKPMLIFPLAVTLLEEHQSPSH